MKNPQAFVSCRPVGQKRDDEGLERWDYWKDEKHKGMHGFSSFMLFMIILFHLPVILKISNQTNKISNRQFNITLLNSLLKDPRHLICSFKSLSWYQFIIAASFYYSITGKAMRSQQLAQWCLLFLNIENNFFCFFKGKVVYI